MPLHRLALTFADVLAAIIGIARLVMDDPSGAAIGLSLGYALNLEAVDPKPSWVQGAQLLLLVVVGAVVVFWSSSSIS